MKRRFSIKIQCLFLLVIFFTFGSCNDPVFYTISQEVAPVEPYIKGGPTNFTVYNEHLIVASGSSIHWYKDGGWDNRGIINIPKPGGRVTYLASTKDNSGVEYLYAICLKEPKSTVVKRYNPAEGWKTMSYTGSYNLFQSIFALNGNLFIGAESGNSFVILYIDGETIEQVTLTEGGTTGLLNGAAFDGSNYYLCTASSRIYNLDITDFSASIIQRDIDARFAGIISLENGDGDAVNPHTIVAIARDGKLFTVNSSSVVYTNSLGNLATGALGIWRDKDDDPGKPKLLMAGRQDSLIYSISSGYTYGYLELDLDSGGIKSDTSFREPGTRLPSTVIDNDNERYKSTIGKQPVTDIFQAPQAIDSNMTLFASTQRGGVWSYRERSGGLQWNAEE